MGCDDPTMHNYLSMHVSLSAFGCTLSFLGHSWLYSSRNSSPPLRYSTRDMCANPVSVSTVRPAPYAKLYSEVVQRSFKLAFCESGSPSLAQGVQTYITLDYTNTRGPQRLSSTAVAPNFVPFSGFTTLHRWREIPTFHRDRDLAL